MSALIERLQALIRIPSPNPSGDTRAIAAYIADVMRAAGCRVTTAAPDSKPEAVSVIATIGQGDPVIMLHAHIDTVPIDANEALRWSSDPYAAEIRDGRIYGKGSIDDKAPLAAMMETMIAVAHHGEALKGTLVLAAAAEEEVGGRLGTRWLADHGYLPMCDFIIVGEQTHNHVATAHKGVLRATIRTTGRSVHATNPDRGINAITAMASIVLALDAYHHNLSGQRHPLVGVPTCNVGVIHGGSTANAVPDSCAIAIDRRMIPGENPALVQQELIAAVSAVDIAPAEATVGDFLVSDWFSSTVDTPLAQLFMGIVSETLAIVPNPIGYLPGSDAKHLRGVLRGEMIIFGPGSYEVAHAYDEYAEIAELEATAHILGRFIDQVLITRQTHHDV